MAIGRKYGLPLLVALLLAVTFIVALNALKPSDGGNVALAAEAGSERRTVTVSGTGEVKADPDVAYLSFGVQTRAETADRAQEDNAKIFAAVKAVLGNTYKIPDKDIRTTGFSVYPEYSYAEREAPKITGYVATHMVEVTYRKLDEIGALLDAVSKAGANQINNVRFDTENAERFELEAMKKAMANARKKAETLAAAENRRIKDVVHISESDVRLNPVFADYGAANKMAADSAGTSISRGEITITARVSVQYEM
jgi:hypothetical protein